MNCPEQTTESEGAIPVITDYAVSDSGRPFAIGWTADETDGCSCRGPNPTTCVPHPGSSRVSIFGNEWEGFGVPSCPHVPDPARSAVPVPRHQFARPAQVCVSAGPSRKPSEFPASRETIRRLARSATDHCGGGPGENGSGQVQRSGTASAVNRMASGMVRGLETGRRMNRGHRAVRGRPEGEIRVPPCLAAREAGLEAACTRGATALPHIVPFRVGPGAGRKSQGSIGFPAFQESVNPACLRVSGPAPGWHGSESWKSVPEKYELDRTTSRRCPLANQRR